jgi:hypothetical protein
MTKWYGITNEELLGTWGTFWEPDGGNILGTYRKQMNPFSDNPWKVRWRCENYCLNLTKEFHNSSSLWKVLLGAGCLVKSFVRYFFLSKFWLQFVEILLLGSFFSSIFDCNSFCWDSFVRFFLLQALAAIIFVRFFTQVSSSAILNLVL